VKKRLADLCYYTNLHYCIHFNDGSIGYLPEAPYDVIIVTAAATPTIPMLLHGRLVIPVHRDMFNEVLVKITRLGE